MKKITLSVAILLGSVVAKGQSTEYITTYGDPRENKIVLNSQTHGDKTIEGGEYTTTYIDYIGTTSILIKFDDELFMMRTMCVNGNCKDYVSFESNVFFKVRGDRTEISISSPFYVECENCDELD